MGCLFPWLPCGVLQDGRALLPQVLLAGIHCAPPSLEAVTALPICSVKGRGNSTPLLLGEWREAGSRGRDGIPSFGFLAAIFFERVLLLISSQL